jgi:hypothetical protein
MACYLERKCATALCIVPRNTCSSDKPTSPLTQTCALRSVWHRQCARCICHRMFYSLQFCDLPQNKKLWEELIACFPWYDTGHVENDASNSSYIVACIFVTAVTFLLSRCLATIGEFLPNRCLATIRGLLPSRCLATIRGLLPSRCQAPIGDTHTHRQQRDLISLFLFFQNNESKLKEGKVKLSL